MTQNQTYDVILTGGGIMGSATAYHLVKADPALKVAVVERDPTYARASTTLSMSNVRIQFSLKENIQISQYAFEVLKGFEEEMAVGGERPKIYFHQEGNLFLVGAENQAAAQKAFDLQRSLGCRIEWWPRGQIRERYPLYSPGEEIVGATFGPDDGHFDAYAVLMAYKAKARSLGAEYVTGDAAAIRVEAGRTAGVELSDGRRMASGCIVNCGGAWAAGLAATAGVKLPVVPVKRQVFALDTAVKPEGPLPLTVLLSGLYFRSETGGLVLLGKSVPEDPVGFNFTWDDQRFMELLWPELAEFVPAWDRLKLVRGWAGLYDVNTLDGNAILGEWPEIKGLYLATGFSGHGLQQGPAVGRYLSELILEQPLSLDLSIFSPQRILENRPLSEAGLV
ncbi:MAG: FAD-binding oxidoreductase [Desulfobacterales bacterium]|jgi:glycine/D-amino acid oxidase-like deaminating enzyme|nr:FAD-binding oxidoreductase [Desulfobacterales bacterium]